MKKFTVCVFVLHKLQFQTIVAPPKLAGAVTPANQNVLPSM